MTNFCFISTLLIFISIIIHNNHAADSLNDKNQALLTCASVLCIEGTLCYDLPFGARCVLACHPKGLQCDSNSRRPYCIDSPFGARCSRKPPKTSDDNNNNALCICPAIFAPVCCKKNINDINGITFSSQCHANCNNYNVNQCTDGACITACTKDAKVCPDGSIVVRDASNNCEFFPCNTFCTADVKQCPDGSYVDRDPDNNCEFRECPNICRDCINPLTQKCDTTVNCYAEPCSVTLCPSYPSARCISNYCGGCHALFSFNGASLDCGCKKPLGNCFVDPCTTATCASDANAKCITNYCGGCNAEFYDAQGNRVNC